MLFGGLAETDSEVIKIGETSSLAFQQIVHFLYAGKIDVLLLDKELMGFSFWSESVLKL